MAKNRDGKKAFLSCIEKARKEKLGQIKGGMRSVAGYVYTTLKRSFRPLPKARQKGRELYIYFPGGRGKYCTVEEFLKGAYRAFGSGSYQKEKVQTRVKGSFMPGTYAEKNQRPGEYFTKGTGRFSDEERENIRNARNPKAAQRRISREIREKESLLDHYKTWSDQQRSEVAGDIKGLARDIRKLKKKHKEAENVKRQHQWRIVARGKHDIPAKKVQPHIMYPQRSKPGEPPRSDPEHGHPLRKGIYYQAFPTGFSIYAVSLYGDLVYRFLEFGGKTVAGSKYGDLLGYTLGRVDTGTKDKKKKYSHKRVSLRPFYDGKCHQQSIRVEPRPFFEPAKMRAAEKIQDIFGGEAADYVSRLKFF